MEIHKKLKYYIDTYHYNHAALAKAIGISPSTLRLKLTGDRKLTADEFVSLCSEMGIGCEVIYDLDIPVEEPDMECTTLVACES